MNRFSRTGGGAISIAHELIEEKGVNLIEVQSGIGTNEEKGKTIVYEKLVEARKQNQERLSPKIPGLERFAQSGNYLGKVPMGYDNYGPRVRDFSKRREEQDIIR